MELEIVANPAPPPLAIRAVLSRDDSDGEASVLSDIVPLDEIGSSSFGSDSDNEEEEEDGLSEKAPSEISSPIVQIPIAKITADEFDDDDEELVIGGEEDDVFVVGGNSIDVKNVKVRASGNEEFEFEEEEGFETASEDDKDDDVFVDTEVSETKDFETFVDEKIVSANTEDIIIDELKVYAQSGNGEIVDSIGVDRREVGDNVTEMVQSKDSVTSVVEEAVSGVSDAKITNVGVDDNQTPFVSEIPDSAQSGNSENDGAKFSNQEDSVVGEHDALKGVEAKENDSTVGESIKTELGSSSHDTDRVDDVAAPEATFDGSMNNADGVLGGDKEIFQQAETAEDTNDTGLDNLHLSESIEEVKDDRKPETDKESLEDIKIQLGSSSRDTDPVDDVAASEAKFDGSMSNADGVLGGDKEIVQQAETVKDNNDTGLDNLHLNESTERVKDDHKPETDKESLEEPGSSSHDTDFVDDVAAPEATFDGSMSNADGVLGGDKEIVQQAEIAEDTNDTALDNLHLSESTEEVKDDRKPETDKESLEELGSSSLDTDCVDDVAAPEATYNGSMSNADGVLGGDKEIVQLAETAEDTNDSGLDNLHLNESTEEADSDNEQDGSKPETDEQSFEGSTDGDETDGLIFGGSAAARQFIREMEQASEKIDGQIITNSEEEADSDNEKDGNKLFDPTAFAALLKAATSTNMGNSNPSVTSQDVTRSTVACPGRPHYSSMFTSPGTTSVSEEKLTEEERNKLDKLQQLRVKFIRLIYRLGHPIEDSVAARVLYRLALAAGRSSIPSFSLEVAKETALKLEEEEGMDDLNFSLNILVLGKSGVGKSATINSIFGVEKVKLNAFEPGTTSVNEITGVVSGVNVTVIDTPGLRSSALENGFNNKVLASVKKFTKKLQPDIVLYVDRLDSRARDLNDLPMLRTITSSLGPPIWRNAIIALTHAASAPPDGPSGSPVGYEMYVAQRSHIVQQCVSQAMGNFRLTGSGMMNPVSLVENHHACSVNSEGQKVLPNGQTWKPQLMLLCFSTKILSEASSTSKAQDSLEQRLPLPYLLSSLLQPRAHPKHASDQNNDDVDSDIDLDEYSDLEVDEEEDEYDQLPPFKPLRKAQIARLSKQQKEAYLDEFDYRVKLLQKKQWKEELKRMKLIKNKGKADDYNLNPEDYNQENEPAPSTVPVPLPDMVLPQTFDGDNPTYRYRFLEPSSQFLARPVLDSHGWDHDCGYDGVSVEQNLGIAGRFPAALAVQVTKDKKDFSLHLDSSVAAKHGEHGASMVCFDIQNIGKQLGYIVRGETKYKKLKKNNLAAGGSVTFLGEKVATALKLEDQVSIGKHLLLVGSTGTIRSNKDTAYGANIEMRLRDADHPIGQDQSSIFLSLMKWKGNLALGANLQSQVSVGRDTKMAFRVALNNKLSGQITVKTTSSDHLQLALAGLVPIAISIFRFIRPGDNQDYEVY